MSPVWRPRSGLKGVPAASSSASRGTAAGSGPSTLSPARPRSMSALNLSTVTFCFEDILFRNLLIRRRCRPCVEPYSPACFLAVAYADKMHSPSQTANAYPMNARSCGRALGARVSRLNAGARRHVRSVRSEGLTQPGVHHIRSFSDSSVFCSGRDGISERCCLSDSAAGSSRTAPISRALASRRDSSSYSAERRRSTAVSMADPACPPLIVLSLNDCIPHPVPPALAFKPIHSAGLASPGSETFSPKLSRT